MQTKLQTRPEMELGWMYVLLADLVKMRGAETGEGSPTDAALGPEC